MRWAAWNRNSEITASISAFPSQCCAKPSTREYSSASGGIHTPIGAMIPVIKIRIGASSAESTPPAPNSDQKIGSWERFMSHPPHDDVDQDRGAQGCGYAPGRNERLGQRTSADAQVGRGLGRHFPPRVGVVADGEQG